MVTDALTNLGSIQDELDKAKNNLKGLNENIRRISGRDPPDIQLRGDRKRSFGVDQRRNDRPTYNSLDRSRNRESPPQKRRQINPEAKSVFSRLSGPPIRDDDGKPKINSRVIKELPTRQEIVAAQGGDAASRARNRRMFGSLLGTLQKFCQEESRLKQKEEKKAQIEKKLEDQQIKEKANMRKERQDLFTNRKRQQMEIKMLEMKMNRIKELGTWEDAKRPLLNFIRTKSKPRLYYLPKILNKKTEKKLADSRSDLEKTITKKRNEVNDELAIIVCRFNIADEAKVPDNGVAEHKDDIMPPTKHDRRSLHEEEEENDSIYNNSDEENNHQNNETDLAPDISIVKQEVTHLDNSKPNDDASMINIAEEHLKQIKPEESSDKKLSEENIQNATE